MGFYYLVMLEFWRVPHFVWTASQKSLNSPRQFWYCRTCRVLICKVAGFVMVCCILWLKIRSFRMVYEYISSISDSCCFTCFLYTCLIYCMFIYCRATLSMFMVVHFFSGTTQLFSTECEILWGHELSHDIEQCLEGHADEPFPLPDVLHRRPGESVGNATWAVPRRWPLNLVGISGMEHVPLDCICYFGTIKRRKMKKYHMDAAEFKVDRCWWWGPIGAMGPALWPKRMPCITWVEASGTQRFPLRIPTSEPPGTWSHATWLRHLRCF